MCGIVGFIGKNAPVLLKAMADSLYHRGPDESGEFIDKESKVSLAMRRLSIIDLETGSQPMSNENETIRVVCNGEIYNFKELKKDLVSKGHIFKTHHSDTEVLIHLYEEKGFDMLKCLNGMFAFVIYDKRKHILFGARDRVGIKPLYYSLKQGIFSFASELKTLLLDQEIIKEIDTQSLYDYLSFQCIASPRTIIKGVNKLEPASYFVFDINTRNLKLNKYWDLSFTDEITDIAKAVELIREETKRAVVDWSLSDVPIACSLSGGIDSSSIVGILSKYGKKELSTFSLGFKDVKNIDELKLARHTAQIYNTKHHEVILEPEDVLLDLDKMVECLDEPYGGGIPSWFIFKIMKGKVKVALTGSGGDELFGNYGKWARYRYFCQS